MSQHSDDTRPPSLNYEAAGVSIDAGNALVDNIKSLTKATHGPEVLTGIGNFAALFDLSTQHYKEPVLVSCTDGVGTKLKVALALNKHDSIGIDLVAMCVNDLIVMGAKPLFFLDYFASARLDVSLATSVVQGIAQACQQSGLALVGGETAEMPGMYHDKDYDLAGFAVGIVDKTAIISGKTVAAGDKLIALPSSGAHANGYSLIRKIVEQSPYDYDSIINGRTLGEQLLEPTCLYPKAFQAAAAAAPIHAVAHITGGGIPENLPRVLPPGFQAVIDQNLWQWPALFHFLQEEGRIEQQEMLRTFNCGVGLILVVRPEDETAVCQALTQVEQQAFVIGHIKKADDSHEGGVCFV